MNELITYKRFAELSAELLKKVGKLSTTNLDSEIHDLSYKWVCRTDDWSTLEIDKSVVVLDILDDKYRDKLMEELRV